MTEAIKLNMDNLHILLVEDDLISQFLMKETLHLWNDTIIIHVADNGVEAIEKLKTHKYDLILLDIHMPKMDGYEVTRIIRTEFPSELRDIPIIAMTGQTAFQYKQFNMNDCVSKPFDADALFETIQSVVSR